ncbi:MAG: IS66 family transposase [Hydrogenophaga sp.]|nr:IS66 family transposase [Hydrogenophaga sp.]
MAKPVNLLERISRENLLALIEYQAEQIEVLKAQNAQLKAQVEKLEGRLAKNSSNSSKPPSSDGLKKPAPKSRREKGKRKPGGQAGHNGETLAMVARPDEVVVHRLTTCSHCHSDLSGVTAERVLKRQVFDLPPIRLHVTEHQTEVKRCPACCRVQQAAFPHGVNAPTQYGPNLLAHAVYLHSYQLLPLARIREWFADCVGQAPSEDTIQRAISQMAEVVAPALDAIYEGLIRAAVVHLDETGLRIATGIGWLHTVSTSVLTYYTVHPKRGDEALLDAGVLPNCHGWAVHDGFKPYFGFKTVRHALCHAHHLRELQFLVEHYGVQWAQDMMTLLRTMKRRCDDAPNGLAHADIQAFEAQFDALLAQGFEQYPIRPRSPTTKRRVAQHPATNLLLRLQTQREAALAFIRHPVVPFDNNLAERDLRMMKVKQKISGGFRTWAGAEVFAAIRSYLSTARKHGLSMLRAAQLAFLGTPFIPAIPE